MKNIFFTENFSENDKLWLLHKHEPWSVIEDRWKSTATQRQTEIIESKDKTLAEIFKQWPRYKDRDGHRLVYNFINFLSPFYVELVYMLFKKCMGFVTFGAIREGLRWEIKDLQDLKTTI